MRNDKSDMRDRHENVGIIVMRVSGERRRGTQEEGIEENEKQSR